MPTRSALIATPDPYTYQVPFDAPGMSMAGALVEWEAAPPSLDDTCIAVVNGYVFLCRPLEDGRVRLRCPLKGGELLDFWPSTILGRVVGYHHARLIQRLSA